MERLQNAIEKISELKGKEKQVQWLSWLMTSNSSVSSSENANTLATRISLVLLFGEEVVQQMINRERGVAAVAAAAAVVDSNKNNNNNNNNKRKKAVDLPVTVEDKKETGKRKSLPRDENVAKAVNVIDIPSGSDSTGDENKNKNKKRKNNNNNNNNNNINNNNNNNNNNKDDDENDGINDDENGSNNEEKSYYKPLAVNNYDKEVSNEDMDERKCARIPKNDYLKAIDEDPKNGICYFNLVKSFQPSTFNDGNKGLKDIKVTLLNGKIFSLKHLMAKAITNSPLNFKILEFLIPLLSPKASIDINHENVSKKDLCMKAIELMNKDESVPVNNLHNRYSSVYHELCSFLSPFETIKFSFANLTREQLFVKGCKKIMIIGGVVMNNSRSPEMICKSLEYYDFDSQEWSAPSHTGSTLKFARKNHASVTLGDGRVFICGGEDQIGKKMNSCEIVDSRYPSRPLVPTENMLFARSCHVAVLIPKNRVLIIGGAESPTSTEIFDVDNNKFVSGPDLNNSGLLSDPEFAATSLLDGRVFVCGGKVKGNTLFATKAIEVYDPTTNSFSFISNLNTGRYGHTATTLMDGRVLIVGGSDCCRHMTTEIFSPKDKKCIIGPMLLRGVTDHSATLLPNGNVILIGGHNGVNAKTQVFVPNSSHFEDGPKLRHVCYRHTAALVQSLKN